MSEPKYAFFRSDVSAAQKAEVQGKGSPQETALAVFKQRMAAQSQRVRPSAASEAAATVEGDQK